MIQKRTTEPSKNSVHAPWIHAAGILTALWLMIVFLITAVEAVAYWTPGYYKMEYEKYQVLDDLPEMTMDDLLSVTDEMMAYLRGNREDLHVFTTMGGEYREFFNAREIAHMEDVRGLFLGGLWLRRIGLMFTLAFAALLYFWKRGRKDRSAYLARAVPGPAPSAQGPAFFSPPAWHWPPSYPQTFPGISLFSTISFLTTTFGSWILTQICSSTSCPRRSLWIRLCGSPLFLPHS